MVFKVITILTLHGQQFTGDTHYARDNYNSLTSAKLPPKNRDGQLKKYSKSEWWNLKRIIKQWLSYAVWLRRCQNAAYKVILCSLSKYEDRICGMKHFLCARITFQVIKKTSNIMDHAIRTIVIAYSVMNNCM